MKIKFIYKILIFLTPLIVFAIGLEMYARSIPNFYSFKKNWMDHHSNKVKTLILGNSHLNSALEPSLLDSAFNLTNGAQQYEYDCYLLSKYIDNCPNLQIVLLSLDYHTLFYTAYEQWDGPEGWRPIYYNLYMDYPKHGVFSPYHYEISCPRFLWGKIEGYTLQLIKGESYKLKIDSLGKYNISKRTPRKLKEKYIKKRMEVGNRDFLETSAKRNIEYLKSMIELCQSHHVRIILVSCPFWHIFNQYADKNKLDILNNTVDSLKEQYQIEFADYREDGRFTNNELLFKDAHHLSEDGADMFTKILMNDYAIK